MPVQYDNDFTALQTASSTAIDVEVSNGQLVDSLGNSIHFGNKPTGVAYRGINDLYVSKVKNASPTGNLSVKNGQPYVDGYGTVTLTDDGERRNVDSIGGASGNDGDIKVDGGGQLYLEYTETTTTTSTTRKDTSITTDGDFPINVTANPPSDATDVFSSAAVKMPPSSSDDDGVELDVQFDRTGDGLIDRQTKVIDYGGDDRNSDVRDTNQDTQPKEVYANYFQAYGNYNDIERSTVAIVWETESTSTTTTTTDISVY